MFLALSGLALASGALAAGKTDSDNGNNNKLNSIKCTAIAFGGADTYSRDAFVNLGAGIGAHICDGSGKGSVRVYAKEVAVAFAKATAASYVECATTGTEVYGHGEAYAKVTASADAWAEALFEGWASIETCTGCKAEGGLLLGATKDLFVKAIAESQTPLEVFGDAEGRSKFRYAGQVISVIKKQVEATMVDVLLEVEREVDRDGVETCTVTTDGCVAIGDDGACCDVTTGASREAISTSEVAKAAVSRKAVGYSCHDEPVDVSAEEFAEAVAEAYVAAVARIDGWCAAEDGATACFWGSSQVSAFASAQARAVASAWVEANNGCNCEMDVDMVSSACEKVFIEAHAAAAADVCVSGDTLDIAEFAGDFKSASVTALAEVFAAAWSDNKTCGVTVGTCVSAGDDNRACCTVSATGYPEDLSEDAHAEAVAIASGWICPEDDGDLEAEAKVVAKAVAKAIAVASIDFDVWCTGKGKAGFCSRLDGWLTAHASAQARALAEAFADTPYGCACEVSAESTAEALQPIYAQVTQDIHRYACAEGGEGVEDADTLTSIAEEQVEVIATALARVRSNGENCDAETTVSVPGKSDSDSNEVCANCRERHQKCAGDEDSGPTVLGCCDPADACVRKSPHAAVCKRVGGRDYERYFAKYGTVLECDKGNDH